MSDLVRDCLRYAMWRQEQDRRQLQNELETAERLILFTQGSINGCKIKLEKIVLNKIELRNAAETLGFLDIDNQE